MITASMGRQGAERYKVKQAEVIDRLAAAPPSQSVFIEFEKTLWLSDPTDKFIASIGQSWLLAILLQWIDILFPWQWLSRKFGKSIRNNVRYHLSSWLFPMALSQWQSQAPSQAAAHINKSLVKSLKVNEHTTLYLYSHHHPDLLQPLLDTLTERLDQSFIFLSSAELAHPEDGVEKPLLVLTSNEMDLDVLRSSDTGFLCQWEGVEVINAGLNPMIPLTYTTKIKYDKTYLGRILLGHDFVLMVILFSLSSERPILCTIAIFMFLLAFFSFYEIGYYENDSRGSRYEKGARISPHFTKLRKYFNPRFAIACGLSFSLVASWLSSNGLSWVPEALGTTGLASVMVIWFAFLLLMFVTWLAYYWHNRVMFKGRIITFFVLQAARTIGFVVIFPTTALAAVYGIAWSVGKWLPYFVYRLEGKAAGMPNHLLMSILFAYMLAPWLVTGVISVSEILTIQGLVIMVLFFFRALNDIRAFREQFAYIPEVDLNGQSEIEEENGHSTVSTEHLKRHSSP